MATSAEALIEHAIILQRGGRAAAAEQTYRRALERGEHPVAQHNLAVLLAQRGEAIAALPYFEAALGNGRETEMYWLSCVRGYLAAGRSAAAIALLADATAAGFASAALDDLSARAHAAERSITAAQLDGRGVALAASGRLNEAIATFEAALSLDANHAEAHFHLGSLLSERGDVARGFEHFMRRAEIVRANPAAAGVPGAPHKVKHDAEQQTWWAANGIDTSGFVVANGQRIEGSAINSSLDESTIHEQWNGASPQLVVIDNFLTAKALARLQKYCAESAIWRRVYDAGYIGATPEDGLACPLLAQIAEEIPTRFSAIFAGHGFRYLGAFKYDSALSTGTNTHADNAAVNVNFYIAPDSANLDPDSGGMEVWDVGAPDEMTMRRLNSNEAVARSFLNASGARATIVPHRENRAIIFRSDLFHRTDRCRFAEGYGNKRINVSLLYGQLQTTAKGA